MEDPQECYKKAEEALKTSFFQWSPDWVSASHFYDRAGKGFKLKGQLEESIQSYTKAAKAHLEAKQALSAAKSYEEIGDILVKQNEGNSKIDVVTIAKICEVYDESAKLLLEDSDLQRASNIDFKAAKCFDKLYTVVCESNQNESAKILEALKASGLNHYVSACEKIVRAGKAMFSMDVFPATLSFCLRIGDYGRATEMVDRMIKLYTAMEQKNRLHQCFLTMIIIHLKRNDLVAAQSFFTESLSDTDYLRSNQSEAAENLIRAIEAGDEEKLVECVKSATILNLDREVVKVARSLKVEDEADMLQ
mmetsp:Transcript_15703/g.17733  ORF Transcript_15703/g.17733 Transcript_15703/m.17733 type:complete len:306 (+) Transcript_15703:123-1040(+)